MKEEDNFWNTLDRISDILQIANYEMLLKDATNNDLMKKLQDQDIVLAEQTEIYLKNIDAKLDILLKQKGGNK